LTGWLLNKLGQGNGYPAFFSTTQGKKLMRKLLTIGGLLVFTLGLTACLHVKEADASTWDVLGWDISKEVGYERAMEGDTQSLYGSLGIGPVSFGATFTDDLAVEGIQFDNAGYDLNLSQDIGWVTVYANNAIDEDFALTETTIGLKWSF
jgi:hypothetical protein